MEFLCTNTGAPHFGFEGTGVALRWGGRLLNARGMVDLAALRGAAQGENVLRFLNGTPP